MLTPSIREDLQLFEGTPMEDGSPTWLLFDTLTNKYFNKLIFTDTTGKQLKLNQ